MDVNTDTLLVDGLSEATPKEDAIKRVVGELEAKDNGVRDFQGAESIAPDDRWKYWLQKLLMLR